MSPAVSPRLLSRIHKPSTSTPPRCRIPPASRALLLQAVDMPAKTVCLVHCHNPWPNEDVYFCQEEGLPTFVFGVPALTSGSEVWIAIHNHRPEPLRLHTGQTVCTLEIVTIADSPPPLPASNSHRQPPVPAHLSPTQQQQLKALFQEFSDIISQGEDDLGCTRYSSTPSRPRDFRSASRIVAKIPLFVERRWPRFNRCCPAASSVPLTVPGHHQSSW